MRWLDCITDSMDMSLSIYLPGILPFFKIHVNQFLAQDDSPAANVTSRHVMGEGPGAIP